MKHYDDKKIGGQPNCHMRHYKSFFASYYRKPLYVDAYLFFQNILHLRQQTSTFKKINHENSSRSLFWSDFRLHYSKDCRSISHYRIRWEFVGSCRMSEADTKDPDKFPSDSVKSYYFSDDLQRNSNAELFLLRASVSSSLLKRISLLLIFQS